MGNYKTAKGSTLIYKHPNMIFLNSPFDTENSAVFHMHPHHQGFRRGPHPLQHHPHFRRSMMMAHAAAKCGFGPSCRRPHAGMKMHEGRRYGNNVRLDDSGDIVKLSLDIPGIKANDLNIKVEQEIPKNVLVISGVRRFSENDTQSIVRKFSLCADSIDVNQMKANLSDGVLVITVPKKRKQVSTSITVPITTTTAEATEEAEV